MPIIATLILWFKLGVRIFKSREKNELAIYLSSLATKFLKQFLKKYCFILLTNPFPSSPSSSPALPFSLHTLKSAALYPLLSSVSSKTHAVRLCLLLWNFLGAEWTNMNCFGSSSPMKVLNSM